MSRFVVAREVPNLFRWVDLYAEALLAVTFFLWRIDQKELARAHGEVLARMCAKMLKEVPNEHGPDPVLYGFHDGQDIRVQEELGFVAPVQDEHDLVLLTAKRATHRIVSIHRANVVDLQNLMDRKWIDTFVESLIVKRAS